MCPHPPIPSWAVMLGYSSTTLTVRFIKFALSDLHGRAAIFSPFFWIKADAKEKKKSCQLSPILQETPWKLTNLGTQIWFDNLLDLRTFLFNMLYAILQVSLIELENLSDFRMQRKLWHGHLGLLHTLSRGKALSFDTPPPSHPIPIILGHIRSRLTLLFSTVYFTWFPDKAPLESKKKKNLDKDKWRYKIFLRGVYNLSTFDLWSASICPASICPCESIIGTI